MLPGPGCEGTVANFQQFFYVDAALLQLAYEAVDILLKIWNQPAGCHCHRYVAQSLLEVAHGALDGQQICLGLQNAHMELHDVIEGRHGTIHTVTGGRRTRLEQNCLGATHVEAMASFYYLRGPTLYPGGAVPAVRRTAAALFFRLLTRTVTGVETQRGV